MTSEGPKIETGPPRAQEPRRVVLVSLLAALLAVGAAVSYVGIQYQPGPTSTTALPATTRPTEAIVRIDLPYEEIALPDGPHREKFQVNCTICHSPRLAFTQPLFGEKKWHEIVHKMVAVYGAPASPEDEREIAGYLSAVHGPAGP